MIASCERRIKAAPTHQLRTPCDIGVLAVNEKVGIEKLSEDGNIVNHFAAIKRRGGGCSENIFEIKIMPVVDFLAASIEMPQHRREIDARRIDELFVGKIEGCANSEQFATYRADLGIDLSGIDQRLYEIRQQQDIGVECQHPLAAGEADGLVLCGGETDVFVVVMNLAALAELLEQIDSTVGRSIINDNDLEIRVLLFEHGFKAALNKSAAIVRHQGDGD